MRFLYVLVFAFLACAISAQKPIIKFKNVSKKDLTKTECSFSPDAHAMILGRYGELHFAYDDHRGWQYEMTIVERRKIFEISDKDMGKFEIRLYEPLTGEAKEELVKFKGYTYNLIGGKMERERVRNSAEYDERINDYWKKTVVEMPDVQKGSVLEVEYTIESNLINNLYTWKFQEDIPVAASEFRFTIPEYFNYRINQVGTVIETDVDEDTESERFSYTWKSGPMQGGRVVRRTETVRSNSQWTRMIARDVPPVIDEPYMNNREDVPARVEFQLITIKMPNQKVDYIAGNYNKFNNELLDRADFGGVLDKSRFVRDWEEEFSGLTPFDKAVSLYNKIQNELAWNGYNGLTSDLSGKKLLREGEGDVADINLNMVAAYRELGFNAFPVILNTRGNGEPHPVYPSYQDFNYVVALVQAENQLYFADAASDMPFGMLPTRCLNGKGWLVDPQQGQWVHLKANAKHESIALMECTLSEEGIEGTLTLNNKGYAGVESSRLLAKKGSEKVKSDLLKELGNWSLDSIAWEENKTADEFTAFLHVTKDMGQGEVLYFDPLITGAVKENPFQREERISPLDFPYHYIRKSIASIKIPEGYVVELPEPVSIKLPEKGGKFSYTVLQDGRDISIMSDLQLFKTDFSPGQYPDIKTFYEQMVEANQQMIVLKKE